MRMLEYREIAPPARLADAVECFWCMRQTGDLTGSHRVVPDGCADILFTRTPGGGSLQVVGPMRRFQDVEIARGQFLVGLRFRPGMWAAPISVPGDRIADQILSLEDLWGRRARTPFDRMMDANNAEQCASLLAQCVPEAPDRTPLQRAIGWMEGRRGFVKLDEVSRAAGLSSRQFRRQCLQQTGFSPLLLARVLRFRHALSQVERYAGAHAGLAADCGYTDQSHMIADFRRFSGRTPGDFLQSTAV